MTGWLRPHELRVGLGCMRHTQDAGATIAAAVEAGITVFDTARVYEGNEALVARALRGVAGTRIVTKGGMARPGGAWVPEGRAKAIRADCEASLEALDGRPIDLYLLHAPARGPSGAPRCARSRASSTKASSHASRLQREPCAAGRVSRARADRSRAGRDERVRRPRAARRHARSLRGARDRRDCTLAARRAAARTSARAS